MPERCRSNGYQSVYVAHASSVKLSVRKSQRPIGEYSMRILLCSPKADGVWFVAVLMHGGHQVDWILGDDKYADVLKGIVPPRLEYQADPSDYDLIVFDDSKEGKFADSLLDTTPVIGSSEFADILEQDRLKGIEFMEMCGINVPQYESFDSIDKAADWVNKLNGRCVFKPSGDIDNKAVTYVSNSPEDMIRQLEILEPKIKGNPFILQEFVEGTEVSTEAWFNGEEFYAINHDLEEKKFMAGGIGPNTGCAGNVLWMPGGNNALFDNTLAHCKTLLRKVSFRGVIDLNVIATKDKVYGLEWTPRFGYEGACNLIHLLPVEFGEFLYKVATGEDVSEANAAKANFAATIRITVPPYPNPSNHVLYEGTPVRGINPEDIDTFYLSDVKLNDDNELVTLGTDGCIGAPICIGETMAEAFEGCEKKIKSLEIPNLQWRNDIGECCQRRYDELSKMGWLDASK